MTNRQTDKDFLFGDGCDPIDDYSAKGKVCGVESLRQLIAALQYLQVQAEERGLTHVPIGNCDPTVGVEASFVASSFGLYLKLSGVRS